MHCGHQPRCPCPAQLRDELRNQDGINEVTAEETTKLLLEISRLQQQNVQLRTDVMHRDEMLRIIQSQLAELNINADESDLWVAPCRLSSACQLLLIVCWTLGCQTGPAAACQCCPLAAAEHVLDDGCRAKASS